MYFFVIDLFIKWRVFWGKKVAEQEKAKMQDRAKRFNMISNDEEDMKKQKRAERFHIAGGNVIILYEKPDFCKFLEFFRFFFDFFDFFFLLNFFEKSLMLII